MNKLSRSQKIVSDRPSSHKHIKLAGLLVIGLAVVLIILSAGSSLLLGVPLYSPFKSAPIKDGVTTSTDQFSYQPGRIQTGVVYHYIKSNIDGSKPAAVDLYVASLERIEAFKIYPHSAAPTLVTANMDWSLFSPGIIESFDLNADGSRSLVANGKLESGDRYLFYIDNLFWVKNTTFSAPVGHYPVHNYNFDLASLNFAFRHLVEPTRDFEIGVHNLCFDLAHLGRVVYLGKATIHYMGEEACHGTQCRKYIVAGDAFGSRQGYLWVNKEGGYFEKVEIPVNNNPGWKDFKLELTGIETMDEEGWDQYMLAQVADFYEENPVSTR